MVVPIDALALLLLDEIVVDEPEPPDNFSASEDTLPSTEDTRWLSPLATRRSSDLEADIFFFELLDEVVYVSYKDKEIYTDFDLVSQYLPQSGLHQRSIKSESHPTTRTSQTQKK